MHTDHIENYIITAPDQPMLDFWDGIALAEQEIEPLIDTFLNNKNTNIYFLIPEERETWSLNDGFAIGLLEGLIKTVRDKHFPELKFQAARDRIRPVNEAKHIDEDSLLEETTTALTDFFHTAWVTYDPLEQYLRGRLTFGILHKDGSFSLPEYSDVRTVKSTGNAAFDQKMKIWMDMFHTALDCMFFENLEQREQVKQYAASAPEQSI